MISFENVCKTYEAGQTILHDINLDVREGELLVLIGPSGSGKTTLLRMINRLTEPTRGRITVRNQDIGRVNPVELRRNIGYVIQNIGLLPHMTIAENIAIVPRLKKWDKAVYMNRVAELLRMVNLDPDVYAGRYPSELSGGQQQRVGVVRALAADPPVILMDEPFSALDPISREQLQDELVRLQEAIRKTIIFVTHDMDEALKIADRICILDKGRIAQLDTPERILRHPAGEFVRNFIGENRLRRSERLPSIREVMAEPVTARPEKGMAAALSQMRMQKVDTLLVVDRNSILLGKASMWDIHAHYHEESMTLKDIAQTDLVTVLEEQPLLDAIQAINKNAIAYLPVVDEKNRLQGVITRASLVNVMDEKFSGDNGWQ